MFFKGSLVLGSVGLDLSSRELDLAQHLEQQVQNPTLGYLHWDTSPTSAPACSFAYLRCIQTTIIFFCLFFKCWKRPKTPSYRAVLVQTPLSYLLQFQDKAQALWLPRS